MIDTLTRRIWATFRDELSLLRRQMSSAGRQVLETGMEGAATAMARKPSCLSHGVSVNVVCYARPAVLGEPALMISVAMHVHPDRRTGDVYWAEADAWARAVAGPERFTVESRGSLELHDGWVFHYALVEKGLSSRIVPLEAAGS